MLSLLFTFKVALFCDLNQEWCASLRGVPGVVTICQLFNPASLGSIESPEFALVLLVYQANKLRMLSLISAVPGQSGKQERYLFRYIHTIPCQVVPLESVLDSLAMR